jgi:tRNA (guanine37-N1)-methyltransferase
MTVPAVLRSGDHARIARWRRDQALIRTARRRPDLLTERVLAQCDTADLRTLQEAGFRLPPDLLAH